MVIESPRAFLEIESPLTRAFVAFNSMINSIVLFCVTMVICYNKQHNLILHIQIQLSDIISIAIERSSNSGSNTSHRYLHRVITYIKSLHNPTPRLSFDDSRTLTLIPGDPCFTDSDTHPHQPMGNQRTTKYTSMSLSVHE